MLDALAALAAPVGLGALAGALGLFAAPEDAIAVLNRYALWVAFPLLVFVGIADASFTVPTAPGFWLVHPLALGACLVVAGAARGGLRAHRGSLALVASFGNVAYLGLPLVERLMGREVLGVASLLVAQHVVWSLLLGPWLLVRWSGGAGGAGAWQRVVVQPLLWAPLAALLARGLPTWALDAVVGLARPVGGSAAPVALFLLGLYLHTHRRHLGALDRVTAAHVGIKLVALPAATAALALGATAAGGLAAEHARLLVLLATMPAAITTFALAQELGQGRDAVARTVVVSTALAAGWVPTVWWLLPR